MSVAVPCRYPVMIVKNFLPASLNKILNLDQFDQVGNRITGLMKRGEQEVLKVDPQDAGTLGECCQVLHQMSPAQLLYCISELQKLIHKNAAGAKEYLKDNPHLAWTMTHACFLVGITDNDVMMREENRVGKRNSSCRCLVKGGRSWCRVSRIHPQPPTRHQQFFGASYFLSHTTHDISTRRQHNCSFLEDVEGSHIHP